MRIDGETSWSKWKIVYWNGDEKPSTRRYIREEQKCLATRTKRYYTEMETKLQKLESTSEKTEFAEQIHSESSNQEAETTSEKTELADQST